jgi:hypothetical protein
MPDAPAKKAATPTNISLAGSVARDVELESIFLRRADVEAFSADPTLRFDELDARVENAPRYERNAADVRVYIAFLLDLSEREEGGPKKVLHVSADYVLHYRVPAETEYQPDALKYFAEINGVINAWPYWRELVHTAASRAGLGGITLPVFRAPKAKAIEPAATTSS